MPDSISWFSLGARWAALPAWYCTPYKASVIVSAFLFFRTRQGTSSVHATSRVGPVDLTRARSARATVGARTPPSMLSLGCMLLSLASSVATFRPSLRRRMRAPSSPACECQALRARMHAGWCMRTFASPSHGDLSCRRSAFWLERWMHAPPSVSARLSSTRARAPPVWMLRA